MPNQPPWPEELDALTAAPHHHTLLFENEFVRVLDTRVTPGQTVPLHTHQWPGALYILSWSDFIRRNADGNIIVDSRTIAQIPEQSALWSAALPPHTLENIGDVELRAISVELKYTQPEAVRLHPILRGVAKQTPQFSAYSPTLDRSSA